MSEEEPVGEPGYASEYSEEGFWNKVKGFAAKAGREVIERALQLYFAAQNPNTPAWARTVIYGALGYFIITPDAVPDVTPIIGFTDDLGVLAAAIATVAMHITPDIKERAKNKTDGWLGSAEAEGGEAPPEA